MALLERLESDLTAALKSGDNFQRDTLRFLKSVLKNAAIDSRQELTDEQIVSIIQKEVKKRTEAEALYSQANKPELAKNEADEAKILRRYLPEQMDEGEIKAVVNDYLAANPTPIGQQGTAMGVLSAKLKGRADLGLVSKILRDQIQGA